MLTELLIFGRLSRLKVSWVQPVALTSVHTGNVVLLLGVPEGVELEFNVVYEL